MDQDNMGQNTEQMPHEAGQTPDMAGVESDMPQETGNQQENIDATERPSNHANMIIIGVFAVLVIALIFIYLWGSRLSASAPNAPVPATPQLVPTAAPEPAPLSNSTNVNAIDADLSATTLDGMDAQLDQMDAELNAAVQ